MADSTDPSAPAPTPLAQALEWGRERFNARFEYFNKNLRRPVDPDEFSIHLLENIGPLAQAVEKADPSSVNKTVEELFEVSLELMGAGYIGPNSRYKWPEKIFRDLLPFCGKPLAQQPRMVAGSMANAALAMEAEPAARPEEWVERMKKAASVATTPKELLDAGMALSWRCGMAHFRAGALELVESLPQALALSIFHDEGATDLADLSRRLSTKWRKNKVTTKPDRPHRPVALMGGFTGFGGPFDSPPTVYLCDGALAARDSVGEFILFADRFGASVQRRGPASKKPSDPKPDKETVRYVKSVFPNAIAGPQARSWAWDGETLAISLNVSHKVFLFSLGRP